MGFHLNFPGGHMYDLARDGSSVFLMDNNAATYHTFSTGDIALLAAWTAAAKGPAGTADSTGHRIVCLFPAVRQVSNVLFATWRSSTNNFPTYSVQYSLDTNNGNDGTWSTIGTYGVNQTNPLSAAQMRSTACNFSTNTTGVKGVRVIVTASGGWAQNYQAFAVWGTTTPTGLVLWHPTLDQQMFNNENSLDRGDVYTNQAPAVQQFRIKNTGSQTANSVVVQMDTNTSLTTLDTDTTFSLDGTNYQATQTISSIAAGATSAIVYMKRGTPTDATGTTRVATLRAIAGTWT